MTPFATGYTEALRASLPAEHRDAPLAPATVERIIADCAWMAAFFGPAWDARGPLALEEMGRGWFRDRQDGAYTDCVRAFPPLTVSLSDDGLIMLREVA